MTTKDIPLDSVEHANEAFTSSGRGLAYGAGGFLAASGLCTALTGAQLLDVTFFEAWMNTIPFLQIAFGAMALGVGIGVTSGRLVAARLGLALAPLLFVGIAGWTLASFFMGILTLMPLFAAFIAAWAAVLMPFAQKTCRLTTEARARLKADGLDLGI